MNVRKEYRIVVSTDVSKEDLKYILTQVVKDKTSEESNIDEIVVFAYDRKEDINRAYTFGKVMWCPKGIWSGVTPEIASSKDRSSYIYVFDIKKKVGNINASGRPTEFEFGVLDSFDLLFDTEDKKIDHNDPLAMVDEDLIMQRVAETHRISVDEASEICTKVITYNVY